MINDAVVRKRLYSWVKVNVSQGVTVIWENQAEHRPAKPYVTLNMIAGPVKRGSDDQEVLETGETRVSGTRELTLSINYLGANAVGAMSALQSSLEFPSTTELLRRDQIAFINDSGVRDLSSQLQENRFETRAQMDVRFRTIGSAVDENSTAIEAVELVNGMDETTIVVGTPYEGEED